MIRGAVYDDQRSRRFQLIRDWTTTPKPRTLNLIGLNPSNAGAVRDDPTSRKGVGFATRWGFTRLVMTNLYATIATDPWDLPRWSGYDYDNEGHLQKTMREADLVVVAWGSVGSRALLKKIEFPEILHWFNQFVRRDLYCIGTTRDGSPLHPSRTAYTTAPVLWRAYNAQGAA